MAGSEWTYGIGKSADREISRLPRDVAGEAKDTIESLLDDQIPPGSVKLRGYVNAYRVRFGNERYRILYRESPPPAYSRVSRTAAADSIREDEKSPILMSGQR